MAKKNINTTKVFCYTKGPSAAHFEVVEVLVQHTETEDSQEDEQGLWYEVVSSRSNSEQAFDHFHTKLFCN